MSEEEKTERKEQEQEEELLPIEKKFVIWSLTAGVILWIILALIFGYPMRH